MPHVNYQSQYDFSGLKELTCPHCEHENSSEKFYHDHESYHDGDEIEVTVKCDDCKKLFAVTMDKYNQCLGFSTAPIKCKDDKHKFTFDRVYTSKDEGTNYKVYACEHCWETDYRKLKANGKEYTKSELQAEYRSKEPMNQVPVNPKIGEVYASEDRLSINTKNAEGNRELYLKILAKLEALGFKIGEVPRMKEQYESLNYYYAHGIWRELEVEVHYYPAGMSLEFYQEAYPGERGPGHGRYEFNKKSYMPYLLKKRLEYTLKELSNYLIKLDGPYQLTMRQEPEIGWHNVPNIEGLSFAAASERIKKYPKDLTKEASYNLTDAKKNKMHNGQEKYFYNYDGILMRGPVYYDLNSTWRVLAAGKVWRIQASELFDFVPGMAIKKSRTKAKEKLEKQMKLAIESQNFERCIVLKEKIKQLTTESK